MNLQVPEPKVSSSLRQEEEGSAVLGDKSDALARVDLPLAERAEFCFYDHMFININIKIISQKMKLYG